MRSYGRKLAGVAALVALLGACGGRDFNQASGQRVSPPANAASSPSAGNGNSAVLLHAVTTTSAAKSAHVKMTVTMGSVNLDAEGDVDFDPLAMQLSMTMPAPVGTIQERVVNDTMYMNMPSLSSELGGKAWIAFDMKKLLGQSLSSLSQGQTDPTQFLAYLGAVSDDVTKVGTETVQGVDTTHYHATIDFQKALNRENLPSSLRDRLQQLAPSLSGVTMTADAWVDDNGLVRKISIEMPMDKLSKGEMGGTATVVEEMSDFGEAVHVEAPPADQTRTLDGLLSGLGGNGP
jgi:hypothetical protein